MVDPKIIGFYEVVASANKDGFCMVFRYPQLLHIQATYWPPILAISTIVFYLNRALNAIVKKGVKPTTNFNLGYDHGNCWQSSSTDRNCIPYYG